MKYVKLSRIPGLEPKDTIITMAKACPNDSAIELQTKNFPVGRGRGALIGSIKKHTGRSFYIHQQNGTVFLIPKKGGKMPATAVVYGTGSDGRQLATENPRRNDLPVMRRLKGNYSNQVVAAVDQYGGVVILKSAFRTRLAKSSAVFKLRRCGYDVAGTSRSSNSIVVTMPAGARKKYASAKTQDLEV
jgi:hypothetical protein